MMASPNPGGEEVGKKALTGCLIDPPCPWWRCLTLQAQSMREGCSMPSQGRKNGSGDETTLPPTPTPNSLRRRPTALSAPAIGPDTRWAMSGTADIPLHPSTWPGDLVGWALQLVHGGGRLGPDSVLRQGHRNWVQWEGATGTPLSSKQ